MQTLFKIAALMPLRVLRAVGLLLGWVTWLASPRYRSQFRANWQRGHDFLQAGGLLAQPTSMFHAIGRAGLLAAELPKIWCDPRAADAMSMQGQSCLDELVSAGRGALVLTPHLGAFELAPRAIGRFHPMTVLYRPSRQPALERLLQTLRPTAAVKTAPANGSGLRQLMRCLRAGETVGMLPDQVPRQGDGIWSSFFGLPAYTMTLPIRLAQSTGAGIVWASALRAPDGWRLTLEPWVPAGGIKADADLEEWVLQLNQKIEALVARSPADYLWAYNRFKTPADKGPGRA